MNIRTIAAGWQKFCLDRIAPQPWRNGGGVTRTIAADREGSDFNWRVSVADIERDGAFSLFPDIDRAAMLVGGSDLLLTSGATRMALRQSGDLAEFAGEARIDAALGNGPVRLWNVMSRRGAARCVPQLHGSEAVELDGAPQVCLVLDGAYRLLVGGSVACELTAGEGVVVGTALPHLQLLPAGTEDCLISARISSAQSEPTFSRSALTL